MHLERASLVAPAGLEALLRELGDGEAGFGGTSVGRGEADVAGFLQACLDGEDPAKIAPEFVPQFVYWMIEGDRVVGMVRLRPTLNEHLLQSGGNIGYYVRPRERRKGFAKQALALALGLLWERGVMRALVTIHPANVPSRAVARALGGTLDPRDVPPDPEREVLHFWLAT